MPFSQTAQYALRAMTCLAAASGEVLKSQQLAEVAEIPPHYVNKVMRPLVVAELVEARRGHHGGFRLVLDPAEVSFAAILEAMGESRPAHECVFGMANCGWDNPCPMHPTWVQLRQALAEWAENTTLADNLEGRSPYLDGPGGP